MNKNITISAKPPIISEDKNKEKFIKEGKIEAELYPWEAPHIREDLIKMFNIRMTEPYFIKLDYISKITRYSKQAICLEAIEQSIDEKLRSLGINK